MTLLLLKQDAHRSWKIVENIPNSCRFYDPLYSFLAFIWLNRNSSARFT